MKGFICQRNMQTDHIGISSQLFHIGFFNISFGKAKFVFIISQNGHIKRSQQICKCRSGISISDNTNSFPFKFYTPVGIPYPFPFFHFRKARGILFINESNMPRTCSATAFRFPSGLLTH